MNKTLKISLALLGAFATAIGAYATLDGLGLTYVQKGYAQEVHKTIKIEQRLLRLGNLRLEWLMLFKEREHASHEGNNALVIQLDAQIKDIEREMETLRKD